MIAALVAFVAIPSSSLFPVAAGNVTVSGDLSTANGGNDITHMMHNWLDKDARLVPSAEVDKIKEALAVALTKQAERDEHWKKIIADLELELKETKTELKETKKLLDAEIAAHKVSKVLLAAEKDAHAKTQMKLDAEEAAHKETKKQLDAEVAAHKETKKLLEKEIAAHKVTKKKLAAEVEAHVATKVELKAEKAAHTETKKKLAAEIAAHAETKKASLLNEEALADARKKLQELTDAMNRMTGTFRDAAEHVAKASDEVQGALNEANATATPLDKKAA